MGNGKLYVIGLGPGGREQITDRALRALEQCGCVAGHALYLELIADLIPGKERIETDMTREIECCQAAFDAALSGKTVALVSSGDAGVYRMAVPLLEVCADYEIEVEIIPAVTAACSGGALAVDATHPYTREISENLRAVCRDGASLRLLRPCIEQEGVIRVPDPKAAVEWLNRHPVRALLTTGIEELSAYTAVGCYRERLFPRVLPSAEAIAACTAPGFPASHIIAMQGPFSREFNAALLRQIRADVLVTKDTGAAGGFAETVAAAREASAAVLVVSRPMEETGQTLEETQRLLAERLGLREPSKPETPPRFPLFLSLAGRAVLVVGAGKIAARRVRVLQRFGARVRVVAPENRAGLENVALRGFRPSDLDGVALAVAAADDRAVNRQVSALCEARGIPVSVADRAEESTFYFPAICEGNGLTAGLVSVDGNHKKVRETAAQIRELLSGGAE